MNYFCSNPNCAMQLLDPRATHSGDQPELDDDIVCGACRSPSVITAVGTRLMTEDDLSKAPPETHKDLRFAIRALDEKLKQS